MSLSSRDREMMERALRVAERAVERIGELEAQLASLWNKAIDLERELAVRGKRPGDDDEITREPRERPARAAAAISE